MSIYLIGYDLNKPRGEDDYPNLIKAIKGISGTWWHHLDSTWLVKSDKTAVQIRNLLQPYLDSGDELLVVLLERWWATWGFSEKAIKWLKDEM
jgi:hypothetical protein